MSLFLAVEALFIGFGLLGLLATVYSLFYHYCKVCNLADDLFFHVSRYGKSDNLLNFFEIPSIRMQEKRDSYLKLVIQGVKDYNKSYAISNSKILCDCRLEVLHELFHLYKYNYGFFFIFEQFYNLRIVEKLFED